MKQSVIYPSSPTLQKLVVNNKGIPTPKCWNPFVLRCRKRVSVAPLYTRNLDTAPCISMASLASAWLEAAISSMEADCSSVAADTV